MSIPDNAVVVEITAPDHIIQAGQFFGLQAAIVALDKADKATLPGFSLALSLLRALAAEEKTELLLRNYRLIAKRGHDISKFKLVGLREHRLVLEPFDLADMAED